MIIHEHNNIYYNVNFYTLDDFMNNNLRLLDGTYPKCIRVKQDLLRTASASEIQTFESKGLITFYQNGEQIKWNDVPE